MHKTIAKVHLSLLLMQLIYGFYFDNNDDLNFEGILKNYKYIKRVEYDVTFPLDQIELYYYYEDRQVLKGIVFSSRTYPSRSIYFGNLSKNIYKVQFEDWPSRFFYEFKQQQHRVILKSLAIETLQLEESPKTQEIFMYQEHFWNRDKTLYIQSFNVKPRKDSKPELFNYFIRFHAIKLKKLYFIDYMKKFSIRIDFKDTTNSLQLSSRIYHFADLKEGYKYYSLDLDDNYIFEATSDLQCMGDIYVLDKGYYAYGTLLWHTIKYSSTQMTYSVELTTYDKIRIGTFEMNISKYRFNKYSVNHYKHMSCIMKAENKMLNQFYPKSYTPQMSKMINKDETHNFPVYVNNSKDYIRIDKQQNKLKKRVSSTPSVVKIKLNESMTEAESNNQMSASEFKDEDASESISEGKVYSKFNEDPEEEIKEEQKPQVEKKKVIKNNMSNLSSKCMNNTTSLATLKDLSEMYNKVKELPVMNGHQSLAKLRKDFVLEKRKQEFLEDKVMFDKPNKLLKTEESALSLMPMKTVMNDENNIYVSPSIAHMFNITVNKLEDNNLSQINSQMDENEFLGFRNDLMAHTIGDMTQFKDSVDMPKEPNNLIRVYKLISMNGKSNKENNAMDQFLSNKLDPNEFIQKVHQKRSVDIPLPKEKNLRTTFYNNINVISRRKFKNA